MIPDVSKRDVKVCGDFKTSSFKIAQTGKMFTLLSKRVYTHEVRAVIREYCCNAIDAHTEAKVSKPYKVHLPTMFEPWFSVRDFGKGLSDEDVRGVFGVYGYSTKDESNEYTGMLGIGAKSFFSIVDSFTVTSYNGGKKSTYSCYIDENGEPQIAQLTEEDTDEPTGLEIQGTVDGKISEFRNEAVKTFQYFDIMPEVNIDIAGEVSDCKKRHVVSTSDFSVSMSRGTMKALMGNVAYEIPRIETGDYKKDELINVPLDGYYKFELGSLDFDSGREVLSLNKKTKQAIVAKAQILLDSIKDILIADIEKEGTPYKKFLKMQQLKRSTLGELIGHRALAVYKLPETKEPMTFYTGHRWSKTVSKETSQELIFNGDVTHIMYVKPRMEARIRYWIKGQDVRVILVTPEQAAELLLDLDIIQDPEVVVPKLPSTAAGASTVNRVRTFVWNGKTYYRSAGNWDEQTIDVADDTEERVYVELNCWEIRNAGRIWRCDDIADLSASVKGYIDFPIVYGLKTAILKMKGFQKANWIKLEDYIKREMQTHAVKSVYTYSRGEEDLLKQIDKSIDNDACTEIVKILKEIDKGAKFVDFCESMGYKIAKDDKADKLADAFFAKYPMLKFLCGSQVKNNVQIVEGYMNGCDQVQG